MRHLLRVVAGAAGHEFGRESQLLRRFVNYASDANVGRRRGSRVGLLEFKLRSGRFLDLLNLELDFLKHHSRLRRVQIAQPKARYDFARDDVVGAGKGLNLADGADLAARHARHHAIDGFDVFGRREQRVAPLVHRRRARVIGEAFDRHVPPVDADDAFDHADVDLLGMQYAALFDVQLKVSRDVAGLTNHAGELISVAADELDAFANGLAAVCDQVQLFLGQADGDGVAADGPAFFVLKDDYFERMSQRDIVLGQRLGHFDCAHRADVAVVIAAFGHGVNVRADDQRFQVHVIARAPPDDVARGVNAHAQLRLAHQLHRVFTAFQIGVAVGEATDAALRILAELGKLAQAPVDALAIDSQFRRRLRQRQSEHRCDVRQVQIEFSTVHFRTCLSLSLMYDRASSQYSGAMSIPTELRLSLFAASQVVPDPIYGSSTQSPGSVKSLMNHSGNAKGKAAL